MPTKNPKTIHEDLQDILLTNRGFQFGVSSGHDDVLRTQRARLRWPHRTPPPGFISKEITQNEGSNFLALPPMLYVVSLPSRCTIALKYLRHMVNVLKIDINAKYCIEDDKVRGVAAGWMTPLGWFLYVTCRDNIDYHAHAPMLYELLRLGSNPNTPVMTNFSTEQQNSPLYVAMVNHTDPTMFFARQLMDFGGTFSLYCDNAPLVAAMKDKGCVDVIDLLADNIAAFWGTQDESSSVDNGYTAMHYFVFSILQSEFNTVGTIHDVKHYINVLNQDLHVSMLNTDSDGNLASTIIKNATNFVGKQELLDYVLQLESYEKRYMTLASARATQQLPRELAAAIQNQVQLDPKFAKRRPGGGS